MTHDSDRTERPISNEELYVKLGQLERLIMLAIAGFFAGLAWLARSGDAITQWMLIVTSVLLLSLYHATVAHGLASRFWSLVTGVDFDETYDEQEERLTGAVRTDGSGGDNDE
jgi:hypothetical protein